MADIKLLYIDLFCGAGGTSTGVTKARLFGKQCAKVLACVNHDANAIASHQANHPDTLHYTEDIRTLELSPLVAHLQKVQKRYPDAYVVLWASLECTNFSRAKGGKPRDADSRTLAEHLFRYIEAIQPDYIQIENVEEFMSWGDLDANGKPVSKDQGRSYLKWVKNVRSYGYDYDYRILNAADFGAYTSRRRFFGQFAKCGLPIVFPVQTYAKNGDEGGMFHQYRKWKAVREVLDLTDEGTSIFTKKKPLCEKTLERIYAGLLKFVAGGKKQYEDWILKYNSMNRSGHYRPSSTDEPCPVVATQNRLGYVKVNFLSKQFSGDPGSKNLSVEKPAGTITCVDHHAFVTAYFGNGYNSSIEKPGPTVTTKERHALVISEFLSEYYGGVDHNHSLDVPATTITTRPRHALVKIDLNEPLPDVPLDKVTIQTNQFIANEYSGGGQIGEINTVSPAILCTPKQKLVSAEQFLMNPQYQSEGRDLEKPCFTLIARMDKMPPYLISTEQGELGIVLYDDDTPMTRKIKEFMAFYGIIDVKMRMLNIRELKRIMGFPEDYTLIGSQAEQKKFIGNAVEVNMSRALCEALAKRLSDYKKIAV
jgi:DNA (cytosine-5)-methyltransferase 1